MQLLSFTGKLLAGERRDDAGIQPAGQKGTDRHIGLQLPVNGIADQRAHRLHRRLQWIRMHTVLHLCIGPAVQAMQIHISAGPRLQLTDALQHTAAADPSRSQQHQLQDAISRQPWSDKRMCQQRLDLAAKENGILAHRVKKRFDAHRVTGDEQLLAIRIPDGKRKDAIEFFHTGVLPFQIRLQDDLRIAVRRQLPSPRKQLGTQFLCIVQLSVVDDAAGSPHHRLTAAFQIDDAQTGMDQRDKGLLPDAFLVRSPPPQRFLHRLHIRCAHRLCRMLIIDDACDSTHVHPPCIITL